MPSSRHATFVVAHTTSTGWEIDGVWVPQEELQGHYERHVQPAAEQQAAAEAAAHRQAREAFASAIEVRRGDRTQRKAGWQFVASGPDVAAVGAASEPTARSILLEQWEKKNPAPKALAYSEWRARLGNTKKRSPWRAALVHAGGDSEELSLDDADISWWGMPLNAINAHLDALTAQGWRIVHVSEDRGVYRGAHASSESYAVRQRYLLARN